MRAIQKDFWREIRNTRNRFFSILVLVALAVAFLSGLRATAPDMKRTCDTYMDEQNFMDIQILSTLGLTKEDVELLGRQKGVEACEGAYVIDAFAHTPELDIVTKVYSLPRTINRLRVTDGRLPERDGECAVDQNLLDDLGLSLGDTVSFQTSGDYADCLRSAAVTIVGTVVSPYYISVERGTSSLGTGHVSAYAFLPEESFDMDCYTTAYLTVTGAGAEVAFSDAYQTLVDDEIDTLEPLGKERAELRRETLVDDANEQLSDAEAKLSDAKDKAKSELDKAWKKLFDARTELDNGWADVRDAKATLASETADAQEKIAVARRDLTDAQIQLDDGEGQYADGYFNYQDGLAEYQDGLAEYEDGLAEYEKNQQSLDDALGELATGRRQLAEARSQLKTSQAGFDTLMAAALSAVNASLPAESAFSDTAALLSALQADTEGTGIRAGTDQALASLYALSALDSASILGLLQSADPADQATAGIALGMALSGVNEGLEAAGLPTYGDVSALAAAMADPTLGSTVCATVDQALGTVHAGLDQPDTAGAASGRPVDSAYLLSAAQALSDGWARYQSGVDQMNDGTQQYYDGKHQLEEAKEALDAAKAKLDDAKKTLDEAAVTLSDSRAELDEGWQSYYDGLQNVEDAEAELAGKTADAQAKIADAVHKLRSGETEYGNGLAEYRDGKAEADEKIADAEHKLTDARRKLAELGESKWYILSRDSNPGYLGFGQDADRMANLASVFPVLFFLVSALVCLTTMTRMVEDERTQIGCLKALGYSRRKISRKYLNYGLLPSLLGGVLGLAVGYTLFPSMIFTAYQIIYELPNIELHQYTGLSVASVAAAAACTTVASLSACLATLTDTPADLMRPRTPKPGKRVVLEAIPFLWRRLSFNRKVTARNLFRYQKRFWMTVVGIGGCAALIIAGFGLRSSLMITMDRQYHDIYHYTAQIAVSGNLLDTERSAVEQYLGSSGSVTDFCPCRMTTLTAESSRYSTSAYLEVVDPARIGEFVKLQAYAGGKALAIPDNGVIIDEKLSELLGLGVGDSLTLDGDSRFSVTVAGITEHYLGHFVYLSPSYYEQVFSTAYRSNAYLLTLNDPSKETCDAVFSDLMALSGVVSATRLLDVRDTYLHSMERVDFVVVIVILCAAALALVVLYNLSNINITERRRELATIKVLGFYDREVSAYVNRENVVLTAAGIALGILAGHFLHSWLVRSVEIDLMMFGRDTNPLAYLWAALLTTGFSIAVNLGVGRYLRKIDMVESLKSAE